MVFHEMFDKASSIAAADNGGGGGRLFANHFGSDGARGSVGGVLGVAEKSVPDNSVSIGNVVCNFGSRKRAYVELLTFGIFVEIFGDVDFVARGFIAVGGDFATYDDMVGDFAEFVDKGLLILDFGTPNDEEDWLGWVFGDFFEVFDLVL